MLWLSGGSHSGRNFLCKYAEFLLLLDRIEAVASTGADSSRMCCEEYRQIAAVFQSGTFALTLGLFALSVLLFLFQD